MRRYLHIDLNAHTVREETFSGEQIAKAGRYFIAKTLFELGAAKVDVQPRDRGGEFVDPPLPRRVPELEPSPPTDQGDHQREDRQVALSPPPFHGVPARPAVVRAYLKTSPSRLAFWKATPKSGARSKLRTNAARTSGSRTLPVMLASVA